MFWIEPSYVLNRRPKFNEFDILPSLRSFNEFDTLPQESPQTPISPPQHRRRNLQDGLLACASSEGRVCFVELIIICWTKFTYQRLWCRMDCCSAMPDDCWSATYISEIILVHRFDRIDLARIFVYTYILHIYIIPKKNNKKLKKNLCFLLVIYVFCFLYVKKWHLNKTLDIWKALDI